MVRYLEMGSSFYTLAVYFGHVTEAKIMIIRSSCIRLYR
jgi:hypothetical protein